MLLIIRREKARASHTFVFIEVKQQLIRQQAVPLGAKYHVFETEALSAIQTQIGSLQDPEHTCSFLPVSF